MRAIVVYESMFGNTHRIAEAIAEGIGNGAAACGIESVVNFDQDFDLLVVGGPTHAHSLSRASTRRVAVDRAMKGERHLDGDVDPAVGVREWLAGLSLSGVAAAAFDTRMSAPAFFTGRASRAIARRLQRAGAVLIAAPTSFLVTKQDELVEGELARAFALGRTLGQRWEQRDVA